MAAVCTVTGGRLQTDGEELPSENTSESIKPAVLPLLDGAKKIKVEDASGEEDSSATDPISSGDHAANVATNVAPPVKIKEERIEDEEYFQIKLGDVGGSSDDRTENNGGADNENVNGDWLFRCVDCGEGFEQREAYQEHRHEHIHDGPIVCLDSDSQWNDLLVSEDGGRRTLCCALCGRKFSNSRGFFTHQLKHRTQALKQEPVAEVGVPVIKHRIFECTDCGKTFSTVGLYLNHQRSHKQASKSVFHQLAHLKKKSFECPTCGRCYSRASALDAHRRCHEVKLIKSRSTGTEKLSAPLEVGEENGEEARDKSRPLLKLQTLKCPDCGELFTHWEAYNIHFCRQGNSKDKKNKKWRRSILNSEKKYTGAVPGEDKWDKNMKCEKEEISLASSSETKPSKGKVQPSITVPPEDKKRIYGSLQKVYACGVCGKVYSYRESFKNHQRLHQDGYEKPNTFPCFECGKVFHRASNLSSHMKVHKNLDDSNIIKCDQCNKTFNSQQTWMSHKEIHRRKPFWCLPCAKGFKDSKGLDRHLLGHKLKRHKCDVCSKTFRVPAELRYHYNTHTGAKPYSCGLCRRTFSQLGNLITHRKKHVGVYKEGSEIPLGYHAKQFAGKRRVMVMKKLIVMGMGEAEEARGAEIIPANLEMEDKSDSEVSGIEEEKVPNEPEADLQCYECGALFSQESVLHQHYMNHASGEI